MTPLFLYAGGAGEGQAEEVIDQADFVTQRRMVFMFEVADTFSEFEQSFIYNSVLSEIFGANPAVVILESEETEVPPTFEARQELSRRVFADSWVLVQVQGDPSNVTFYYETFDILTVNRIGEQTIETGLRLDLRAITRGNLWEGLVTAIQDNYTYLLDTEELVFNGLSGTQITEVIDDEITLDDTGTTTLTLQNPASYTYRALLDGYYPVRDEILLGYESLTIDLAQIPTINFAFDFQLNNFQFLGFHAYWFPAPADFFIRFGFTTYAFGLYFISDSPGLVRSNPLTVIKFHTGVYFFDKEELLRPYAAIGAGLRVAHGVGVDPVTPIEISLTAGVEYSFPDRFFRLYAEYNPIMFISTDIQEFREGSFFNYLFDDGQIPGFLITADTLAFDFRNFSAGIRLTF